MSCAVFQGRPLRIQYFRGVPFAYWAVYDTETGLHYNWRRYYAGGRYLEPDPIGYKAGDVNIYRYAIGNPLLFIDPNGLEMAQVPGAVYKALVEGAKGVRSAVLNLGKEAESKPPIKHALETTQDKLGRVFEGSQYGAGTGAGFNLDALGLVNTKIEAEAIRGKKLNKKCQLEQFYEDDKFTASLEIPGIVTISSDEPYISRGAFSISDLGSSGQWTSCEWEASYQLEKGF